MSKDKKLTKPELAIVLFDKSDVICTSDYFDPRDDEKITDNPIATEEDYFT